MFIIIIKVFIFIYYFNEIVFEFIYGDPSLGRTCNFFFLMSRGWTALGFLEYYSSVSLVGTQPVMCQVFFVASPLISFISSVKRELIMNFCVVCRRRRTNFFFYLSEYCTFVNISQRFQKPLKWKVLNKQVTKMDLRGCELSMLPTACVLDTNGVKRPAA